MALESHFIVIVLDIVCGRSIPVSTVFQWFPLKILLFSLVKWYLFKLRCVFCQLSLLSPTCLFFAYWYCNQQFGGERWGELHQEDVLQDGWSSTSRVKTLTEEKSRFFMGSCSFSKSFFFFKMIPSLRQFCCLFFFFWWRAWLKKLHTLVFHLWPCVGCAGTAVYVVT